MATNLRCRHTGLPNGFIDFSDYETGVIRVSAGGQPDTHYSQVGDVKSYIKYIDHYTINAEIKVGFYDTLIKLFWLRDLHDEFYCYPYFPDDPSTRFTVIWLNWHEWEERWSKGYPQANWTFTVQFIEPRGATCHPPS